VAAITFIYRAGQNKYLAMPWVNPWPDQLLPLLAVVWHAHYNLINHSVAHVQALRGEQIMDSGVPMIMLKNFLTYMSDTNIPMLPSALAKTMPTVIF
jgi:hypothetical protein